MRGDKNIANILTRRTLSTNVIATPTSFEEIMDINTNEESLSRYRFEVGETGEKENMLDEYIVYLSDETFLHRVRFEPDEIFYLVGRIANVALLLYGDVNMAWAIPYLNDLVNHPSDLTTDILKSGIVAFNETGIEALEDLEKFIKNNEENSSVSGSGNTSMWGGNDK